MDGPSRGSLGAGSCQGPDKTWPEGPQERGARYNSRSGQAPPPRARPRAIDRPLDTMRALPLLLLTLPALAQDAERALLVVDPDNAESRYVANYYAAARGIPARNVVYMDPSAASYLAWTQVQRHGFLGALRNRGLEESIDFVVLPPGDEFFVPASGYVDDTCFPVNRFATPSCFTLARQADGILAGGESSNGANQYRINNWGPRGFQSRLAWLLGEPSEGDNAERYYLGAMLGWTGQNGNTLQEVLAMIDRSVAADHSLPAGTFYYCETSDPSRSGPRHDAYTPAATEILARGGQAQHLLANLPTGNHDCLGVMTGLANPAIDDPAFSLLPGAFADHLTSYAATFTNNSQTKMSRWIAKGASGTAGTIEEPCNYSGKFPHARLHVVYFRGLTLGEAWFRSHGFRPYQELLLADPLTRPFGKPPTVDVPSPPSGPQSGTVTITPTTSAVGGGNSVDELTLFVDGEPVQEITGGSFSLDTTSLADGWHELRVRGVDGKLWRNQSSWLGGLEVDNHAGEMTLAAQAAAGDLGTAFALDHAATGKPVDHVVLLQHERVLAASSSASGTLTVFGQDLGAGEVVVQAEARFTDGTRARSAPVALSVDYSGGGSATAAPVAHDFTLRVREDEAFVLNLPSTTDDDPAAVTTTLLTSPAQATVLGGAGSWRVLRPAPDALGSDVLTYRATGPGGASAVGTITLVYEDVDGCDPVQRYCVAAPNSVGPGATLQHAGSVSAAANDLTLTASGCPPGQFGIFFYGQGQVQNPLGDGFLCVGSGHARFPATSIDAAGTATLVVDGSDLPSGGAPLDPGTTHGFQFWYRDPGAGGSGSNLSDALSATFCD